MKKISTRMMSLALCLAMLLSMSVTAFAYGESTAEVADPYTIEGKYVQELLVLDESEISALTISDANELFEEAFGVSAKAYTEDEIRLALDGWAFFLKYQAFNAVMRAAAASTTSDKYYYGSIGLVWTRDTTRGNSPLTLGEILSGVYTLEVDYISWKTAASILAASASYSTYSNLVNSMGAGVTGSALSVIICSALGITAGGPATIASTIVGVAVGFGWNWLSAIERDRMYSCFEDMGQNDYMRVQFMWASNMVNRFYEVYTPSSYCFKNPFPGKYGTWQTHTYGYLYNYQHLAKLHK